MKQLIKILIFALVLMRSVFAFATEDFTTWTEVDPSGYLTITSTQSSWVDMPANSTDTYLYYDFGVDSITDFEIDATIQASGVNTSSFYAASHLAVGNSVDDAFNQSDRILSYFTSTSFSVYTIVIAAVGSGSDSGTLSYGTTYYVDFDRASTTMTMRIYSDSGKTTLVDTLSAVCISTALRYATVTSGYTAGGAGRNADGFVQDYTITYGGGSSNSVAIASGVTLSGVTLSGTNA